MKLTTLWGYASRIPASALIIACLVLGLALIEQRAELHSVREHDAEAALATVNTEAERDTTRSIATATADIAALLGDSLALVERDVVQVTQQRDALDVALQRERRASYAMNVSLDSLRTLALASPNVTPDTSNGTRRASFDMRQPPYRISADVAIPAPPGSARMTLAVTLDTIPMKARLTCVPYVAHGASAAAIVAESPPWAHVDFREVAQAPEICNPPRPAGHHLAFKPLSVGVGRAAVWGGATGWALFVGAVLTLN